jgi:hypothetical protein
MFKGLMVAMGATLRNQSSRPSARTIAMSVLKVDPLPLSNFGRRQQLMQSGRDNEKEVKEAINPRILRSAYVEGTTRDAVCDIGIVRNQAGRRVDISIERSAVARQRALGSLHEVTLSKLREPPRAIQ